MKIKKRIILIISIVILFGCDKTKTNKSENLTYMYEEKKSDSTTQSVSLSLLSSEFKLSEIPHAIKITMSNNTNDTLTTGEFFLIEKFENKEWIDCMPKDISFIDIGYILKPYKDKTFNISLFKNQINYKLGKYRIAKKYLKSNYQQTKKDFNVYAEFEIN